MELAEAVAAIMDVMRQDAFCDGEKASNHGWSARIDGYGETPTPERLFDNMKAAGVPVPAKPRQIGERWDLNDCDKSKFPFQSHHLIPKKHLPTHAVCVWLTAKWTKDPKYKLTEDTNFDTDHARNGYFMPFASNLAQWKNASDAQKDVICDTLMAKTGIQLHQGSHTAEKYADEVEDIETGGYLTTVDSFLTLVRAQAFIHYRMCTVCKAPGGKTEVQPLPSVVNHVYRVAELLKALIQSNRIFVSARAAARWKKNLV